ncbi:MAG: hypothetical protein GX197_05125 [Firmicutes bacterium]|nr:hypothetical protein [Bacillota bacterium]
MKKRFLYLLLVLLLVFALAACSSNENAEPEENLDPGPVQEEASGGEEKKEPTYKEKMVPYDQLEPTERIVFLQNSLNYSREGFYTPETKPAAETITYNGDNVEAYSLSYAIDFLTKGLEGEVTITLNDGSKQALAAEDFAGMYVSIDFTSEEPPVLYNPETGTEITDFLFAQTQAGEVIYSVVSGSVYNAAELIDTIGWDPEVTYRYVATDKFYIPVAPAERETGEIRGTLSGAINGSFPDLTIAGGKINDLLFIEMMN